MSIALKVPIGTEVSDYRLGSAGMAFLTQTHDGSGHAYNRSFANHSQVLLTIVGFSRCSRRDDKHDTQKIIG